MLFKFLRRNPRVLCFLLFIPVILSFYLCGLRDCERTLIHCAADDWIPFTPIFVIPYVLWFPYIPLLLAAVCFTDPRAFRRQCFSFFGGAAFCTLILLVFPTAIDFRPEIAGGGNNFFEWICSLLFRVDRPVSIFPSLHCYEAVCAHMTTFSTPKLRRKTGWRIASAVLCVLICLATVFIKQHSVLDLISGVLIGFAAALPAVLLNRKSARAEELTPV